MNKTAMKPAASELATRALALAMDLLTTTGPEETPDGNLARLGQQLDAADAAMRLVEHGPAGAFENAYAVGSAVVAAIEAHPAKTFDDLRVKARAVLWCCGDEPLVADRGMTTDERLAFAIVKDILTIKSAV